MIVLISLLEDPARSSRVTYLLPSACSLPNSSLRLGLILHLGRAWLANYCELEVHKPERQHIAVFQQPVLTLLEFDIVDKGAVRAETGARDRDG